jgi:hypothetical protein
VTDQPTSGSRWEPPAPDHATHRAPGAPTPRPGPGPAQPSPAGTGLPSATNPWGHGYPEAAWHQATSREIGRPGRRAWVAGVAAALFLGGSAGGYAAGHRSADDVLTPGVGSPDSARTGNGAPNRDGFGVGGGNAG